MSGTVAQVIDIMNKRRLSTGSKISTHHQLIESMIRWIISTEHQAESEFTTLNFQASFKHEFQQKLCGNR